MAIKKCCVKNCMSCSTSKEDIGVTYHKFPKDATLCKSWMKVTQYKQAVLPSYVCSRHFRKNDFQINKDLKYVLKSGAVPSIFSWNTKLNKNTSQALEMDTVDTGMNSPDIKDNENIENTEETLNSSKESEVENLEAIRKFIEDQDKSISDAKAKLNKDVVADEPKEPKHNQEETQKDEAAINNIFKASEDDTMSVACSVMDMILSESEAKIAKKEVAKVLSKQTLAVGEKGNGMSLSVGSRVEAKDYGEFWHIAEIVEVDFDEMEVLVHYENVSKKHDEWISVSSPRLRPISSLSDKTSDVAQPPEAAAVDSSVPLNESNDVCVKEENKPDEKPKVTFVVGERCLARWRDNRRFIATITEDSGNGNYEILFDDGARWSCATSRLYKLREKSRKDPLSVDTTSCPTSASPPSPVYSPGSDGVWTTTNADGVSVPIAPAFHTHLFDPTRDYLGSKSERREMKRKLNIKEIFNIGQKKRKLETASKKRERLPRAAAEKKPKLVRNKIKVERKNVVVKKEIKTEIPDAVASIIGTVTEDVATNSALEVKEEMATKEDSNLKLEVEDGMELANSETLSAPETEEMKTILDAFEDIEVKLEKFEPPSDTTHEKVIDRMKEVINKLEDGLRNESSEIKKEIIVSPKLELKEETVVKADDSPKSVVVSDTATATEQVKPEKPKKNLSKIKKSKKLRLLQEKKVKKQVEKVKCELEDMKKQVEEMRKQMLMKTEELEKSKATPANPEMPLSFLLPGEWCCKWVNGQPVGTVSEIASDGKIDANRPALPRRSVQVEDQRLPPGWTKHMVRRSIGSSAGKWDVVIISPEPENRRLHTKTDMRMYLEHLADETLVPYENALLDFGIHLKLSRRMGWYTMTPGGEQQAPMITLPAGTLSGTSPLVKRKSLSLKRSIDRVKDRSKKIRIKMKSSKRRHESARSMTAEPDPDVDIQLETPIEVPPLEDGYVYVGSLKVQVIENLLRCPAEGCFKNFRNNTLIKMHIKHYHRELRKMLGATPKVLDLAYARTRPTDREIRQLKLEAQHKTIKVKLPRLPKRVLLPKLEPKESVPDIPDIEIPITPVKPEPVRIPRSQDSPKLRKALTPKPVRRPKVLLPVRRPDPEPVPEEEPEEHLDVEEDIEPEEIEFPYIEPLDFETAISTHTVTKPLDIRRKGDKKRKSFISVSKRPGSEDEEWFTINNSDVETRSSYPRSGTPDSKIIEQKFVSSESNEEQKDANLYTLTETGERIKIVHMKREEIINCHCGFREEDGLMVQCELCLCWQHALCHNIQRESEVPDKYTCSICLNPRRGRRSQRFLHDQDRLYEGLLPGAKPCESLRRSHELSGNLLRIEDALHALRVKYHVATKKDHPKLYLWAKDWETGEITKTQEKLNSDYSDLNIMISNIGKENLPIKPEEIKDMTLDMRTPPSEDPESERFTQKDNQLGSQALLSGLLSSPGGASLDLPISTSELERLAKSVQEQDSQRCVTAPQPEAAIENSACRERLLRHIQRCQTLIDARLDSIEAQVAELESQDPSFEDDETADYFPRTKQTVQMLMRDLDTMEELGVIT